MFNINEIVTALLNIKRYYLHEKEMKSHPTGIYIKYSELVELFQSMYNVKNKLTEKRNEKADTDNTIND